MKVGDLIIRKFDGILAIVVRTNRQHHGIIQVQFYAVPYPSHTVWCDQLAKDWRLQ